MTAAAVIYLPTASDAAVAAHTVAGRPVVFRAIASAVRGGATRVYVPAAFGPGLGPALAAAPRVARAITWLNAGTPAPGGALLVPATAVLGPGAITAMRLAPPPAVHAASHDAGTPVVGTDAATLAPLWPALVAGAPIGDALAKIAAAAPLVRDPSLFQRVRDGASAAAAERRLYATLGSAIDTRLDTAFHRRFSRLVSRVAVARGITPNTITLASLLLGLGAAWCFWQATAAGAVAGLVVYALAVILDHADGEIARLTLTESAVGEWLDVGADTLTHVAIVLALGAASGAVTGRGTALGVVAALGFVASAAVAKAWPGIVMPDRVGTAISGLGNRDGFYAMLIGFIAARAVLPEALPWLMIVVAAGAHAFWVGRVLYRVARGA
ncbi:MAG TPA: CDP-alcohol phosphatidyltransferase family protein [Terriglobales bacterium]|nr:CDP-alcohol phosphatidyltransferase family protein [Terriglobales bacterium]